jgi:hypothetical protein
MLAHKGRQEMENPKSNFDWVNARAQCSLLVVFKQLEWGCQEDVKSANAKRKEGGHFKFEVASFPSRFCVLIDGDFSEKREVNFSLEKNGIKIGSAQQSVEVCILRGFPESDEFGLGGCQALRLQ